MNAMNLDHVTLRTADLEGTRQPSFKTCSV